MNKGLSALHPLAILFIKLGLNDLPLLALQRSTAFQDLYGAEMSILEGVCDNCLAVMGKWVGRKPAIIVFKLFLAG